MSETGAEPQFMRDSIQSAIEENLAARGGGFVQSFVYAAEAVDHTGEPVMFLGGPLEQDTVRSLGLTDYLVKWYDEEARELIGKSKACDGCAECSGDD